MTYSEIIPSDNLKELVHNYWKFEISERFNHGKPFLFEVLPENKLSIVFVNMPYSKRITLLGIQSKRMKKEVYPGSIFLGIRFNPWVNIDGLFNDKVSTSNQILEIPANLKHLFSEFNISHISPNFSNYDLIEKWLLKLIVRSTVTYDPMIKFICLQLDEGKKINEIIKDIPLSIRPIQKQFKNLTGMTMSEYRNINRLRKTVSSIYLKQKSISSAAFENDYTDHAHFLNSFKKLMKGSSLSSFLSHIETIEHHI